MANEVENAGAGVLNWFVRQAGQVVKGALGQSGIVQGVLRDAAGGDQNQPRPRPDARGAEWTNTPNLPLSAGPADVSKQFMVKPTANRIAKLVESGIVDGGVAQKMINDGHVILPDARTIGIQEPAPLETRGGGGVSTVIATAAIQPIAQGIQTGVDPIGDFIRASETEASTSKPSPTAAVDSLIEQANKGSDPGRLETLKKARAQIANIGEPAP